MAIRLLPIDAHEEEVLESTGVPAAPVQEQWEFMEASGARQGSRGSLEVPLELCQESMEAPVDSQPGSRGSTEVPMEVPVDPRQGYQGSMEVPSSELPFDVRMLGEDLRTVLNNIRRDILRQPQMRATVASDAICITNPSDMFCQASLGGSIGGSDPRQNLSWMLLGFSSKQHKYIGESLQWVEPAEMRSQERCLGQLMLDSLKDFLGSRHGRAIPFALVTLGGIGIAFLEMALKGQCAIGPVTGHQLMIRGKFRVNISSSVGVSPHYSSIEDVYRPIYDGIHGLDAILNELKDESLGFRAWATPKP